MSFRFHSCFAHIAGIWFRAHRWVVVGVALQACVQHLEGRICRKAGSGWDEKANAMQA